MENNEEYMISYKLDRSFLPILPIHILESKAFSHRVQEKRQLSIAAVFPNKAVRSNFMEMVPVPFMLLERFQGGITNPV